jgi:integrase
MTAKKMTHPKLERHGDQWRHAKRVPADVAHHFPIKTLRFKTSADATKAEARALCSRWLADKEAEFQQFRNLDAPAQAGTIPVRQGLTAQDIGIILQAECERYKLEKLAADGVGLAHYPEYRHAADRRLLVLGIEEESARLAADGIAEELSPFISTGLVRLRSVGVVLDAASPYAAQVGSAFADAALDVAEVIHQRVAGGRPVVPNPPERASTPLLPARTGLHLSDVLKAFMDRQDQDAAMYRKYQAVLPMLQEVIGDMPMQDIRQKMLEDYFDMLLRLPPRWKDLQQKTGQTVQELAAKEWPKCIAPKTFKSTYIAAVRPFLKYAKRVYGDQGFPGHLTVEGIAYRGDREEGENQQRPITADELRRLFNGSECASFAADPALHGRYWLPLIGLYTGARVNEVCQINPQCDIRQDPETGIWFFDITDESATAADVVKSVKNELSKRAVPIHSKLLALGLLAYVARIRTQGASLLFPEFAPSKGKASGEAEKWFRRHLEVLGLRDVTPKARLVGFHAFRFTLVHQAEVIHEPRVDAITGHAREGETKVGQGYRKGTPLPIKQQILERFIFDIDPARPV